MRRIIMHARGGHMREKGASMTMTGTVKFFNSERGYGFIKPDGGGREVFVHRSAMDRAGVKSLNPGQRVTFDLELGKMGKGRLTM